MDFLTTIEKMNAAVSDKQAFDILVQFSSQYGFNQLVHTHFNDIENKTINNFPLHWSDQYFQEQLYKADPVVRYSLAMMRDFNWCDNRFRSLIDTDENKFMEEARNAGLKNGFTIPVEKFSGYSGIISFSTHADHDNEKSTFDLLKLAGLKLHEIRSDKSGLTSIPLSIREMDVLTWIADGKTYSMISEILNIKEVTVQFHVKNSMKKLDAATREVAIIKAYSMGLISPQAIRY